MNFERWPGYLSEEIDEKLDSGMAADKAAFGKVIFKTLWREWRPGQGNQGYQPFKDH